MGAPPLTCAWAIHQALHHGREAPERLLWRVQAHLHTVEQLQYTLLMSLVTRFLDSRARRCGATAPRRRDSFQNVL